MGLGVIFFNILSLLNVFALHINCLSVYFLPLDNTAWVLTRRSGFRQHEQSTFYLPILISDNGRPVLSSTGTLTVHVCSCDQEGMVMSCNAEAYVLPVSLSRGALIAILACIFVLLGKKAFTSWEGQTFLFWPGGC